MTTEPGPMTDREFAGIRARARDPLTSHDEDKARLIDEVVRLRAVLDQFRSFPSTPGPGAWGPAYRTGYADAAADVQALVAAALGETGGTDAP